MARRQVFMNGGFWGTLLTSVSKIGGPFSSWFLGSDKFLYLKPEWFFPALE